MDDLNEHGSWLLGNCHQCGEPGDVAGHGHFMAVVWHRVNTPSG